MQSSAIPLTKRAAAILFRRRPSRFTLLLAALSLLSAGLVLARTATYGVGLEWDPINYLGVARNLLAGHGFINVLGHNDPYTTYAPLYPMALAAAGFGLFDPYHVAAPLNAALLGLTVFVMGQYFRRHLKSPFLQVWASAAVALSIPLIWAASFALSASLFILLTSLALIQCDKFLEKGQTSALILTAIFSALAWQTRYVGVAAPAAIGLMLLFQPGATTVQKAKRVSVYSLIAAAPMGLWLMYNYLRIGELIGNRRPVDYSWPEIWRDITNIAAQGWEQIGFPLLERISAASGLSWLAFIIATLAATLLLPLICIYIAGIWRSRHQAECRSIIIFSAFTLLYLIIITAGAVLGNTEYGIQARYLFPLYLPLLAIAALLMDAFISHSKAGNTPQSITRLPLTGVYARWRINTIPLPTAVLMITLCLVTAIALLSNIQEINRANSDGLNSLTNSRWANSDTLQYIQKNSLSGQIYSNRPMLVYIYTDGSGRYWGMPTNRPDRGSVGNRESDKPAGGAEQLRQWLETAPDGAYVVWLHQDYGNDLFDYGPAELRAAPGLAPVADFDDGIIFRVWGGQK